MPKKVETGMLSQSFQGESEFKTELVLNKQTKTENREDWKILPWPQLDMSIDSMFFNP